MPHRLRATSDIAAYRADALGYLSDRFAHDGPVFRLPGGVLCVADPVAAKNIMANVGNRYRENSDFFHTRSGTFGPRSAQIAIGQDARQLLEARLDARSGRLPDLIARSWEPTSAWPDAGNHLVLAHLRDALLDPDAGGGPHAVIDQVVARAVLAGARESRGRVDRAVFRRRAIRALSTEVTARRAASDGPARDVFDVVVRTAPGTTPAAQLAEVFLSFVFAVVGATGFVLGWSVYLGATDIARDARPGWIVREAMRLWPVAWLFGRTPVQTDIIGPETAQPGAELLVCSYLVHRHPGHWTDPDAFRPERWAGAGDRRAYLPFGWGAHACVGASLVTRLVEDVLGIVRGRYRMRVEAAGPGRRPVAPMLAPPPFTLTLSS